MPEKEVAQLGLDQAIKILSGREAGDKLSKVEIFFIKRLNEIPAEDHEARAESYYYLLRCKLNRNAIYETQDLHDLYGNVISKMKEAEQKHLNNHRQNTSKLTERQIKAFYQLTEHQLSNLEQAYKHKHLTENMHRAYEDKMKFRRAHHHFGRNYLKWIGYSVLELTSKYGNSFGRWGITSFLAVLFFSLAYFLLDSFYPQGRLLTAELAHWYNYPYFSIVTFTTLGYGDIVPLTWAHKFLAGTEAVFGYFMLGVFVNLLNRKL